MTAGSLFSDHGRLLTTLQLLNRCEQQLSNKLIEGDSAGSGKRRQALEHFPV
ncbi:hypothetical protein KBY70_01115 [Cyanobium sp. ATX 6E8]|uniref:hypothetical protein n=1 Tax=Cyanobium sp. ATX 6E8 TaxID=2823701 RepID=UPI0020CE5635|nr:hypothetical protein [Cyanobium sp. ATX 6E8]MCP9941003.1 hypothetical protein [Cyanobium sp. ATX 6E8]